MYWWQMYIFVCVFSLFLSWICTSMACRLAPHLGLIDKPKNEAHKNHSAPIPVAGGVGMCVAWTLILFIGTLGSQSSYRLISVQNEAMRSGVHSVLGLILIIVGCALFLMIAGMLDDRSAMKPGRKFLLQFLAAGVTCWFGPRVLSGYLPFSLSWLLSVLWIMTVINAINFFDNMDGLAGGTTLIATFFFMAIAIYRGQNFVAMLAAATCGATGGFLILNAPPAKIFMGDSGSHFLGYLLGVISIMTTFYVSGDTPTMLPLLIPLIVLGIPLLDAITVVIIRICLHKPIYVGDNRHISHRFVNLGMSRAQSVLMVCLLSVIAGASSLTLLWLPWYGALLVLCQILVVFCLILGIQLSASRN